MHKNSRRLSILPYLFILSVVAGVGAYAAGLSAGKALLVWLGVFAALNVLFVLFWFAVALTVGSTGPVEKQSPICQLGCSVIAGWLCAWGRVHVTLSGMELLPKEGRFLLVCNHRSMYDPIVKAFFLREYNITFLSKPSNLALPGIGRLAWGAGFLAINRENDREALKAILQAANFLKRDVCSIGVYPEGTRAKTGKLLPFHAGSFKIAQRAKVPVVIAAIQGTEKLSKNFPLHRTQVALDILDVIPAEQVKAMNTQELAACSREKIAAHFGEALE